MSCCVEDGFLSDRILEAGTLGYSLDLELFESPVGEKRASSSALVSGDGDMLRIRLELPTRTASMKLVGGVGSSVSGAASEAFPLRLSSSALRQARWMI